MLGLERYFSLSDSLSTWKRTFRCDMDIFISIKIRHDPFHLFYILYIYIYEVRVTNFTYVLAVVLMSSQNGGQINSIKVAKKSFENVARFIYFERTVTNEVTFTKRLIAD